MLPMRLSASSSGARACRMAPSISVRARQWLVALADGDDRAVVLVEDGEVAQEAVVRIGQHFGQVGIQFGQPSARGVGTEGEVEGDGVFLGDAFGIAVHGVVHQPQAVPDQQAHHQRLHYGTEHQKLRA
jgi:hypothetical protein